MKKYNTKKNKIHNLYIEMCIIIIDDNLYSFQHELIKSFLMNELYYK